MRRSILILAAILAFTPASRAQGLYPSGGYLGQPYTGGYLAGGYGYGAGYGAAAVGVALGAGLLGAIIGAALTQPQAQPAMVVEGPYQVVTATRPVAVAPVTNIAPAGHVRPRCPSGTAPTPRPLYDAYGTYLGQQLVCY